MILSANKLPHGKVRRIAAACRLAHQNTIGTVAELGRVLDDVQAIAVVVTAVHPVVDIIPPALDIPVLGKAVVPVW